MNHPSCVGYQPGRPAPMNLPGLSRRCSVVMTIDIDPAQTAVLRPAPTGLPVGLPVMEAFYTVQGEGTFAGRAAYFIRLGGCDVGCHWCDVKDSWDAARWPQQSTSQLVTDALAYPGRLAVITGGEPLMHDLGPLTQALQTAGFQTNIETSGVCQAVTGAWDWVCFSPKKFKKPNPDIYHRADELKVIVYNPSDFGFAESFVPHLRPDCRLLLQPEWSRSDEIMPRIVDYAKANPQWHISLQTHKFMAIP